VGLTYIVVARLEDVMEGVATMANLGGKEGLLGMGQGIGRALLPLLVALMMVEWVSKRRHAGTLVAPLLTAALIFRGVEWLELVEPSARLAFEVAGLLGCVWLGFRARPSALPSPASTGEGAPSQPESASPSTGRRSLFTGAGALLLSGSVSVGGIDARRLWRRWDSLGPLARGDEVPPFRARTLDGGAFDRAALTGAPTMLVFWATWCGYCARQMPSIERIHRTFRGRGLRVVGVNTDRAADQAAVVRGYVTNKELSFPQVLDTGRVARAFRNSMLPHVVFVDADGEIVRVFQGKTDEETLVQVLEGMLARAVDAPR
jgi:thiol-disulfide isomerase/thioredoxin